MKKQNGITLIALIITIVVLLIIAVVAVGAVQESGIIAHAQNAAGGYKTKADEENTILDGYLATIEENLPGGEKDSNIELVSIVGTYGDNTTAKSQRWYTFNENGTGDYGYYDDGEKVVITNNFTYSVLNNGIVTVTLEDSSTVEILFEAKVDDNGNILNKIIYADKYTETRENPERTIECYEYVLTTNGSNGLDKVADGTIYTNIDTEKTFEKLAFIDGKLTGIFKSGSTDIYKDYFKKDNYLYTQYSSNSTNIFASEIFVIWNDTNFECAN